MSTAHHRAFNTVVNGNYSGATGDFGGAVAPFVQILDESMCVIREDICDWLQRYLFSEANVPPLDNACDLLERLKSGVWLARLAYKLHFKVLAANLPRCPRGVKVTSREHKLYASLRGTGPSNALGQLTAENLPPFSRPLKLAAEAQLSNLDVATKVPTPTPSDRYSAADVGARLRIQWTSRGNISAFLEWCHDLGISQTVLFETTGLVNRTEEKNVLLTLMDLARLASRFGLAELPELVRMEREIEVLEAERLERLAANASTNTRPIPPEDTKVDVSLYASRVADRRLSVSGLCQNPKSERRSKPRLISTNTTTTGCHVNVDAATTTSTTDRLLASTNTERTTSDCCTVTEVFPGNETTVIVEVSTEGEDKAVGTSERAPSTDQGISTATATFPSDFVGNAACQANSNNATQEEAVNAGSSSAINSLTSTVFVDVDFDESASIASSLVSSSPKACPSIATMPRPPRRTPAPRNGATAAMNQFGFAKRSTSAADLREISDPNVKRRNIRDSETSRGLPSQSRSREATKSGIPTKAGLKVQNQRSRSHSRPPLTERDQLLKSHKPQVLQSFSSSPKLSSGFASRSSSCSDLAAEVRRQTAKCTCCSRNRLVRLDEGRYQMGSRIYYLRRFRSHIMVRVGGGWLTLPQFLDRYDPCRQKEGNLVTTGQSSTGDGVSSVRVPTSNLLTSWPSTEAVNPAR